ncbi:hypothetical protein ACKUB1_13680 [Methanospirillum stamsii]|uniref:Uncharacterized protein n=1 Tax=Methanospirillum stamsii TaxID=1277351 RepID=A0A2V2N3W7_9EURY|nr:hypothetical protein [Methanospirillum stamsii]PWR74842.1 hypothetical protein DLD82_08060 [Methanospirillum stamsii]
MEHRVISVATRDELAHRFGKHIVDAAEEEGLITVIASDYERGRLFGEWSALHEAWEIIEKSEKKSEMLDKMLLLFQRNKEQSQHEQEAYTEFITKCHQLREAMA